MSQENIEIARGFYDAYRAGDFPSETFSYSDVRFVASGTLKLSHAELPADLAERFDRKRRHLLWRLGRPELPRGRVPGDKHRRRNDDHR
jgi:hypothetical protein